MNLSRNWLNEFVDLHDITDKQFNDEMTLSGSKVETIERLDESLKNVVAGKILSMEKHPDSDHMWVCQLDVGREEPVQIVTGAPNVHEGDLVPVAKVGAILPGGIKIKKGKLRGVAFLKLRFQFGNRFFQFRFISIKIYKTSAVHQPFLTFQIIL